MKDKYNLFSVGLIALGMFTSWLLLRSLSTDEFKLINIISIIGSIASVVGFSIAIIQLYKISSNTATYEHTFTRTLADIRKNETIALISRALQQVIIIKQCFEMDRLDFTRGNFNILVSDLSLLCNNSKLGDEEKKKINDYIEFCSTLETEIYLKEVSNDKNHLREKYNFLSQIQIYLISFEALVKTPNQNEQ